MSGTRANQGIQQLIAKKHCHVVGLTHIDLAWLWDSKHYAECQEKAVVRLLDCLEQDADFTYVIEQFAHYRALAQRRPDLIGKLRTYVEDGRVEVAGGMASSLDTNGVNGESYVRNHLLGRSWVKEHLGGRAVVGDLIDTFGLSAQTPQIYQQFGIPYMFANRLGGCVPDEIFYCQGLDGSTLLMAGPDGHTPNRRVQRVHMLQANGRHENVDQLFDNAASAPVEDGPLLVLVYDENEQVPLHRSRHQIEAKNEHSEDGTWGYSSLHSFFMAVEAFGKDWPVLDADMSPAFTGCYGLRPFVRMENRKLETLLLEAEKWAVLTGVTGFKKQLDDAWWTMAHIQSHDVYSGSFPHAVRAEVAGWLADTQEVAESVLTRTLGTTTVTPTDDTCAVVLANGLPWERHDVATIALPTGWSGINAVRSEDAELAFEVRGSAVRILAEVPAVGRQAVVLERGPEQVSASAPAVVESAVIENEFIRVACASDLGIQNIVLLATGEEVATNCGALLVVQQDTGIYQVDAPKGGEWPLEWSGVTVHEPVVTPLGQSLTMRGVCAPLSWAGSESRLEWKIELTLLNGKPRLDVCVQIDWVGEASRIRLRLPTNIDSARGAYEIPFGVVNRTPYGIRDRANGEWPAHRFVAIQDSRHGVALVNTGTMGGEVLGGRIYATLFRAPATPWVKLVPDETSSQHGHHTYPFAIVPYAGSLAESPVLRSAQEVNDPLLARFPSSVLTESASLLDLSPGSCVLSAVKPPEDEAEGEVIIRFYESVGLPTTATLRVDGLRHAWQSDLLEEKGEAISAEADILQIPVKPFEICTLRIARRA
ncbi:MAG: glycosyl hydrolase-related protein [Verrucomicrobia bacterium]|nr:glycosyl hydrolase-related protein [Verrucomicrobiota bacterium]